MRGCLIPGAMGGGAAVALAMGHPVMAVVAVLLGFGVAPFRAKVVPACA